MKKFILFLLCLLAAAVLFGCDRAPAESTASGENASDVSSDASSAVSKEEEYIILNTDALYIRADSSCSDSFEALFPMANPNGLAISSRQHLPVLHFENAEEFAARVDKLGDCFQLDVPYNGDPAFTEQVSVFDNAFFEENDLLAVYVSSPSGSIRYEVTNADIYDGTLMIWVAEDRPEIGTDDVADWFILLPVPKTAVAACSEIDAVLTGGSW